MKYTVWLSVHAFSRVFQSRVFSAPTRTWSQTGSQLAFGQLSAGLRHAHAGLRPGLRPVCDLESVMEFGLNAANLHHLTSQYAALLYSTEIVLLTEVTVTSRHLMYSA